MKIKSRKEFLDNYKKNKKEIILNEALANDVNWGDSLLGRLINSFIRKASIGIDLRKMDNVIKSLIYQFDILKEQISVKKDSDTSNGIFYLYVSTLFGLLIKEIEEYTSIQNVISVVESNIDQITYYIPTDDDSTKKEKDILIKKYGQFLKFLKELESQPKTQSQSNVVNSEESEEIEIDTSVKAVDNTKQIPAVTNNSTLEESDEIISQIHNSIGGIKSDGSFQLNRDEESELKKLYWELAKIVSPDKIKTTGLSEELSNDYMVKLNNLNDSENLEGMKMFKMFIDLYFKTINVRKEILSKRQTNFSKDSVEQLKKKLENEKYKDHWDKIKSILKRRGVKVDESLIRNYRTFILENVQEESESTQSLIRKQFHIIFEESFMKKYQLTKSPEELEKEFVSKSEKSITIDPIIEIVKLFNRAYKLHTPGPIPSGRKSGKVSNSVFREYEFVGKGSEGARMAEDGGVNPGMGPYRNKSLFNKWENAVLDIIKKPEYQQIFNEKTYFHFSPADPRYNTQSKKKGGGKALLKLINSLLDGSDLYKEGAQSKFISEYFDVEIDDNNLGYKKYGDMDSNNKVAQTVKSDTKYKFINFNTNKVVKHSDYKNMIFKTESDEKTWFLKVERVIDKNLIIIMTNGFPYDIKLYKREEELTDNGNIWLASSDKSKFGDYEINKKRIKVGEKELLDDKDETEFTFESFEVLSDEDGDYFKEDSNMKKPIHKLKSDVVRGLKDNELESKLLK
jgi:hypothetical protein